MPETFAPYTRINPTPKTGWTADLIWDSSDGSEENEWMCFRKTVRFAWTAKSTVFQERPLTGKKEPRCFVVKKLNKTLAVLISLCLLAGLVPVLPLAAAAPLRLTVAADTHFQCSADLGAFSEDYTAHLLNPELYGYASTQGQMHYESEAILAELLAAFEASDSDYLLIAGDLTCGKRPSHLAFAKHLHRAEQTSGKRIFVINGNHDCAAEGSETEISMEDFRNIYAEFGYNEAVSRHNSSASYAVDLNEQYRLLAIDSCFYGEDDGKLGADVFRWIKTQTKQAKADGKMLIAMMHHSILPHYELQPILDRWQIYAAWFADHGIRIVLTGHIHANDISSTVSDRGNVLYDIQTGALISAPNAWRELCFDGNGVAVTTRFTEKIDGSLLPDMLTAQQKALLQADFPAYARAYFVSGVGKWLNRNVGSPNRLARWFRLKAGTKAYAAAEALTGTLGDAVGQNIYGPVDSIEAALTPFGVTVPPSDYRKPYEVAATLMYGFFHGDEQSVSTGADVSLLLTCLEGAILSAVRDLPDKEALGALVYQLTGKPLSAPSLRKAAEKLALALLKTLAGGIADDYSDPADLNVTLPFSAAGETVLLHPLLRFFRLWGGFVKRLF